MGTHICFGSQVCGLKLYFSPGGAHESRFLGPLSEVLNQQVPDGSREMRLSSTVDHAGEARVKTLSGTFGAVSLARTLHNAPPNPLLIRLSRDNERMISGHVLRALQRRGCHGLSAAPPHEPALGFEACSSACGRPSASGPFTVRSL